MPVRLRVLNVGCFGGGTGLPSLLGGLKRNPWIDLHAIVTMFDSGGSSGQLRDELGVLPPGDVLKCALTLARNEREARQILLARLPMLEHGRLAGHTGGNLLLSMMEQYTGGDFLAAVDGLARAARMPRPCLADHGPALDALRGVRTTDQRRGEKSKWTRARPAAAPIGRLWLDPPVAIHPRVAGRDPIARRGCDRPRQLLSRACCRSFSSDGCREALADVRGPVIYVANLLTEGRGMAGFTAAQAVARLTEAIGRPVDVVIFNSEPPPDAPCSSSTRASTRCRCRSGRCPSGCQVIEGGFWRRSIARHDRARLRAAVWAAQWPIGSLEHGIRPASGHRAVVSGDRARALR